MFKRFLFSGIWSSAQDHAVLVLFLNLVGFFISTAWSDGNVLYHSCTSFEGASRGGQPLNIFTWFIGAGGDLDLALGVVDSNIDLTCTRLLSAPCPLPPPLSSAPSSAAAREPFWDPEDNKKSCQKTLFVKFLLHNSFSKSNMIIWFKLIWV